MDNNNFGSDVTGSGSSADNAATSQGYTGSDIGSNIPEYKSGHKYSAGLYKSRHKYATEFHQSGYR